MITYSDHILILSEKHVRRIIREYCAFFNRARPHQGIEQQILISPPTPNITGPIRCRYVLGGIIHDYYRDAA